VGLRVNKKKKKKKIKKLPKQKKKKHVPPSHLLPVEARYQMSAKRTPVKTIPTSTTRQNAKTTQQSNRKNAVSSYRSAPSIPRSLPYNGESLFVDSPSANINCNSSGDIRLMVAIPQGPGVNQRIGKRAFYRSITLRGAVFAGSTMTLADTSVLIIYDKRPTGALPAITDILTTTTPSGFMNDSNSGRFEVIRRMDTIVTGSQSAPNSNSMINFDHYIPLKSRPVVFETAGTGAIGDIDSGALYIICMSAVGAGTNAPSASLSWRIRYGENP